MGRTTTKKPVETDENLNTRSKRSVKVVDYAEDSPAPKRLKGRPKKDVGDTVEVKKEIEDQTASLAPTRSKRKVSTQEIKKDEVENSTSTRTKRKVATQEIKKEKDDEVADSTAEAAKTNTKKGGKKAKNVPVKEEKVSVSKTTKNKKNAKDLNGVKEEEEVVTTKSSKGKKSGKEAKPVEIKSAVERSVVKKGMAAVDGLCPIAGSSHVYYESKTDVWDCMLNQTNIQFNNNKYYLIQLLKDDNKEAFSVWMRWGRVGCTGQSSLKPFGSNLASAKSTFMKKFSDKTRNDWDLRDAFEKVPGKYDLLEMDYSEGKDEVDQVQKINTENNSVKKVESKLEEKVKCLISLICDVKAMEAAVVEMKYDAKKAPLGKLTVDQVKAGYAALRQIEEIVNETNFSNNSLLHACNTFYTRIPHYFGMRVPPMIRTLQEIREKMKLLEALGDIQAAMNVINQPLDENMHPIDQQYNGIQCDIEALNKADEEYKMLEKYLTTTHGKTHCMYKMKLLDIFKVRKGSEEKRFKDVGNRMLLWHGSRLTNWAGILSQGLRIAPPEAPCTGYMFGKGIYFADMSSKSANYCMPSAKNNVGLLTLCDVSLGKCNELINADYKANKLPKGCHSVKGMGRTVPNPKNCVTLPDGLTVPIGPGIDHSDKNYTLQYNEYIVYDVAQVLIKYLFKVQFTF